MRGRDVPEVDDLLADGEDHGNASQDVFEHLISVQRLIDAADLRHDIIWYLCAVFDAGKLEWFAQVISTGLQLETETPMPTIYEALIERGVV
jgi:hypothetical protein